MPSWLTEVAGVSLEISIWNPCICRVLNYVLKLRRVGCAKGLTVVSGVSLENKNSESIHFLWFEHCLKDKESLLFLGSDRSVRCLSRK